MSINASTVLETSTKRLFPDKTAEQALAHLLLERAQKNLIKFQSMSRHFETKYKQNFEDVRKKILKSKPSFELEQDYFDWELAVTGIADMEREIERLQNIEES